MTLYKHLDFGLKVIGGYITFEKYYFSSFRKDTHFFNIFILGIGVFVVGIFGIAGNIATILALRRKKRPCITCGCFAFCGEKDVGENRSNQDNSSLRNSVNPNSSSIINMNDCFYKLLIGLAVIDCVLIIYLMGEISIIGVFITGEPIWFKVKVPA